MPVKKKSCRFAATAPTICSAAATDTGFAHAAATITSTGFDGGQATVTDCCCNYLTNCITEVDTDATLNAKSLTGRFDHSHAVLAAAVKGCIGYRAPATAIRAKEAADEQYRRCVPAVWQQGAVQLQLARPVDIVIQTVHRNMVRLDTGIRIVHT